MRWISAGYAAPAERAQLIALYAFRISILQVKHAVTEPGIAAIRYQWWREALQEVVDGKGVRAHPVAAFLYEANMGSRAHLARLEAAIDVEAEQFEDRQNANPLTIIDRQKAFEEQFSVCRLAVLSSDNDISASDHAALNDAEGVLTALQVMAPTRLGGSQPKSQRKDPVIPQEKRALIVPQITQVADATGDVLRTAPPAIAAPHAHLSLLKPLLEKRLTAIGARLRIFLSIATGRY
ncbi:MAG: squalene/phytoene synthase family protein [Pseudomonadota bacterium]